MPKYKEYGDHPSQQAKKSAALAAASNKPKKLPMRKASGK